jgi:choline-sulfatase
VSSKPNVLLLMADEHPCFLTGCYGHGTVRTPSLDRLAADGVVFDAAYCASPLCAPSRAAMMTGRQITALECWDNAAPLRSDWPTFAHSFRAAGYLTALCGKMHFVGPDQRHGFEERWTQDIYPATFDWTPSTRERIAPGTGQHARRVLEAGPGRSRDMDYDDEVMFRTEYGLRRLARTSAGRPWMLCVSFTGPHYPFKCPQEYWDLYTDEAVGMPALSRQAAGADSGATGWLREYGGFGEDLPAAAVLAARHAIFGRTTMVDEFFGRILRLLGELGMTGDTLVVYTSDHGDMLGERGLWFKCVPHEPSVKVPLIFSGPGVPAGRREGEVVSHLDLGVTLCSLAGIEPIYETTDGRDVADLVRGGREPGEGCAVIEYYAEGVMRGWRALRRGDWKLVTCPGFEPDLFNLAEDPQELANRAADPDCAELLADMQRELAASAPRPPDELDEMRHLSEERRLAVFRAVGEVCPADWQKPSPSPPHPLDFR